MCGYKLFNGATWVFRDEGVLYTYDAGTDSGVNYTSSNANTNPHDPITVLDRFPFTTGVPIGKWTIQRVPEPTFAIQLFAGACVLGFRSTRRPSARSTPDFGA